MGANAAATGNDNGSYHAKTLRPRMLTAQKIFRSPWMARPIRFGPPPQP